MPELPEVETVRRGLNQTTLYQIIQGGDVLLNRTIAHPVSVSEFLSGLQQTAIVHWHRRGKYLLAELHTKNQPAGWLGVHLRMTGQLLWLCPNDPLQKHTRIRLFFANNKELRFVDQRTFGQIWWVPPNLSPNQIITGLQTLGPEPFSADFSPLYFRTQLQHRQRPIKNALLDQTIVAGIGNIYADETLYLTGVRPSTLCCDLTVSQIDSIRTNLIQVLEASIDSGGTSFNTFRNVEGINGNYGRQAWVYGRTHQTCYRCKTLIERIKLAGRSAHFCPQCQPIKHRETYYEHH